MQIAVETVSDLERKLTFSVPVKDVDNQIKQRLQKASQTIKLAGFRPGKVPISEVKRRYGSSIRQEVLNEAAQEKFYDALVESKLTPAGRPTIEPAIESSAEDVTFVATFEIYPEIEVCDLSTLKIEKQTAQVSDTDLDTMLETLQKNQTTWQDVERASQDGDQVTIDFKGTIEGDEFEGGSANDVPLILGSKSMIEGFEDGLLNLNKEQEKTLDLKFPDEYQNKDLAGKAVQFHVKVKKVCEPILPELNAEFFEKFGLKDADLEKFKQEIRTSMDRELSQGINTLVKQHVFDSLLESHDVKVPKALIESESENMRNQFIQNMGGQAQIQPDQLPKEMFAQEAERRVALGLIIKAIIEKNNIEIDQERVQNWITEKAQSYEKPQDVMTWYNTNSQAKAQVESMILEEQVIDHVLATAKVAENETSYNEIMEEVRKRGS